MSADYLTDPLPSEIEEGLQIIEHIQPDVNAAAWSTARAIAWATRCIVRMLWMIYGEMKDIRQTVNAIYQYL